MKMPPGVSTLPYFKDGANDGRINVDLEDDDYEPVESGARSIGQRVDDMVREARAWLKDTAVWESAVDDASGSVSVRNALIDAYLAGYRVGLTENFKAGLKARADRRDAERD